MKLINIHNQKRTVYLFCRDKDGKQIITEDSSFFPYFYEEHPEGQFNSYNGKKLKKIFVSSPSDVPKRRNDKSWEADILYCNRYIIDRIDNINKTNIKYFLIDIETLSDVFPNQDEALYTISCISIYNSMYNNIQTWYLEDYDGNLKDKELNLLRDFTKYIMNERPDLWISWNVGFDYNYIYNRLTNISNTPQNFGEIISPIKQCRYGDGKVLYPAGISIVDYLVWFKAFTRNKDKFYALDKVAQKHLDENSFGKIKFDKLSMKIKEKNINDVRRMSKLEKKYHIIDHFDEIRRFSKTDWESLGKWNSRIIDMLLLKEAKKLNIVLPMKPKEEIDSDFEGAYRETYHKGVYFNVGKYDLSGAYMYAIIDLCLDSSNIKEDSQNTLSVRVTDRESRKIIKCYNIEQNSNSLLPLVAHKLVESKNLIKIEKSKLNPNTEEYRNIDKKYEALKVIVLSAWGVMGNKYFRLYDSRIASMITSTVRDLIWYVEDKLKELNYEILFVDTDGFVINDKGNNIVDKLNDIVKVWSQERFNKEMSISFDYEGHFDNIFVATKCRYKGNLRTANGIKEETKGLEIIRRDSSNYVQKFQEELLNKILNKESKDSVYSWIKNELDNFKNLSLVDIAFPCKLAKNPEEYKNVPIFVRALNNTPNFNASIGSNFYYIYVKPQKKVGQKTVIKIKKEDTDKTIILDEDISRKEGIEYAQKKYEKLELSSKDISVTRLKDKPADVMAFAEDNFKHITKDMIDWKRMIERNILMKLETVFEAMNWDLQKFLNSLKLSLNLGWFKGQISTISPKIDKDTDKIKENKPNLTEHIENKEDIDKVERKEIKPYYAE